MRALTLPILVVSGLLATPLAAQTDFRDIVSGLAQQMMNQEADRAAFQQAQSQNTAVAYRSYLKQYPQGANRAAAESALQKLEPSVKPVNPPRTEPNRPRPTEPVRQPQPEAGTISAPSVEAAIGLTRSQRIEIQQQLTALKYPTGVADGLWGSNTRTAIARWQTANKLSPSGYVTVKQVRMIAEQAGPKPGTGTSGSATNDDPVEETLLSLTSDERREVQRQLTSLGYSTGGVDGAFGANTRRALSTWQRDEGLRVTGYLTADQVRELRRQAG